jgi:hypothetical protein
MNSHLFAFALAACVAVARAELTEKSEHLDRGKQGVADKLIVFRDGEVIYERFVQDRDRDGTFENYIESFSVGGKKVFQFALVGGSRGTILRRDSAAQVIFSSERDSWRPDGVFIELENKRFEMFALRPNGFFYPVDDEEKERIGGVSRATDELWDSVRKGDGKGAMRAIDKLKNTPPPK